MACAACTTIPTKGPCTTQATRLTNEQIDSLSPTQAANVLANNEQLAKEGCAAPNK